MLRLVSYCERTSDSVWAEPFNLASNLAFLVLAMQVWLQNRADVAQGHPTSQEPVVLAALLALIAAGSTAFHALPSTLTLILDFVPIVTLFAWLSYRLTSIVCELSARQSALCAVVMIGCCLLLGRVPMFNGALFYLPPWIAAITLWFAARQTDAYRGCLFLAASFTAALVARQLDLALCQNNHVGTHFLWHIFAAVSAWCAIDLIRQSTMAQLRGLR